MATLAVQNVVDAGTNPTLGAVGATDRADVGNGLNTFKRRIIKSGAASRTKRYFTLVNCIQSLEAMKFV